MLSKLFSLDHKRKFLSALIPMLAGVLGIDTKILWALIVVAGLYILFNFAQKVLFAIIELKKFQLAKSE